MQPDVLLVHNIGYLEPQLSKRLANVFKNYADGVSLALLGRQRHDGSLVAPADDAPPDGTPVEGSNHDPTTPGASLSNERASRFAHLQVLSPRAQVRVSRAFMEPPPPRETRHIHGREDISSASRRTVIWHAHASTLRAAGVARLLNHCNGRLVKTTAFDQAPSAAPSSAESSVHGPYGQPTWTSSDAISARSWSEVAGI